jgi:hypothetical protein
MQTTAAAAEAGKPEPCEEPDCDWTEEEVEALLIQAAEALPGMSLYVSSSGARILERGQYGLNKVSRWAPRYCTERERKALVVYAMSKVPHRTDLKQAHFAREFLNIHPTTLWRWRKAGVKKIARGLKRDGIPRFRLVPDKFGHLTLQFYKPEPPTQQDDQ